MNKNVLVEQINSNFQVLPNKPANVLKRIKGVVSDNKSNRNGRIYPMSLWQNVVKSDYVKEMINNHSLFGEADHPETRLEISLQNVSHAINDLWIEGDKVMAVIDILPTPMGKILSELLDYGTNLGISSRGAGTVLADNSVDPDDYQFVTFDFVARPSCEAARMNTILESAAIEAKNTKDDEINNLLESYKSGLKESGRVLSIEEAREMLSDDDAEGLDMVLDYLSDRKVNLEKDSLSTIEDLVHEAVYHYNEGNAEPEYEGEEFYGREYNARNIYNVILKMYGRDKQINESLAPEKRMEIAKEIEQVPSTKDMIYIINNIEDKELVEELYKLYDEKFNDKSDFEEIKLALTAYLRSGFIKEATIEPEAMYDKLNEYDVDMVGEGFMHMCNLGRVNSELMKAVLNFCRDANSEELFESIRDRHVSDTVKNLLS